ncbi:uncharacterized protein LOC142328446 [Lycorma delicatula]|uniref:uncharacterized protein LOC142328446 n=1 Tax=Lycorma delicatula TaxID=130591 RepID=UPI003F51A3E3
MENTYLSSVFNAQFESTRLSDASASEQRNILRDNYSLEEIFMIKLKKLSSLTQELGDLYEMDNSFHPEKTFIDFATFFKEKRNFLNSLCNVLQESPPSSYPEYRAEAIVKLLENLEEEIIQLKDTENKLKEEKIEYCSKNQSSINRCQHLQEVMERSNTDKTKSDDVTAILEKVLREEFLSSRNDLIYVLEKMFPENKSMKTILEELVLAYEQTDERKKWVKVTKDMDIDCIFYLIKQCIVKKHPLDSTKIALVQ